VYGCTASVCDDKAKVSVGAPGHPISTKVKHRGRSLAPIDEECEGATARGLVEEAEDHDFGVGSVTPAVTLRCTLPRSMDSSMVQGEMTVNLYDSGFCPSTGWR
jgi:hypothetical protein